MINRTLIRLKVVQLVYAYYQNEGKTTEVALKELDFSLQKSYDLYRSLLYLLVELRRIAQHKADVRANSVLRTDKGNDARIAENKFLLQLEENKQLAEWASKQKTSWSTEDKFLKQLYETLLEDETFTSYIDRGDFSYESDRELIRRFYKTHIIGNESIDAVLEEQSLYWNDDKEIVDTFVLKTIKRFTEDSTEDQALLPAYADSEDQSFGMKLFSVAIERGDEFREMMKHNTRNWDFSRMALMDIIIIQTALAEVVSLASIPLNVTFSEYIEIAKYYSTPRSASYVHGMLDTIVKQLRESGEVLK